MRLRLVLLLVALLLALPASAQARDFFVDSREGSDLGPGTREKPWRSLARVSRALLQPGDRVLFRRNRIFRGTLRPGSSGTAELPIVYSAYGRGGGGGDAQPARHPLPERSLGLGARRRGVVARSWNRREPRPGGA
ncbi:hypothetical protein [Desulfohalovibrio reitneri]|uniref:hypothetical protein n=1 Tax=Desulfohalovibrio reitneri TaxID=1307759 RepID=UPI000A7C0B8B|nr:hypothetical protein [Desulfohalovibrio reitneri]